MEGFVVSRVKEQFCWILHMWCWANLHQNPIIYIYIHIYNPSFSGEKTHVDCETPMPPCLDDYPRNRGSGWIALVWGVSHVEMGELTPATNQLQGPWGGFIYYIYYYIYRYVFNIYIHIYIHDIYIYYLYGYIISIFHLCIYTTIILYLSIFLFIHPSIHPSYHPTILSICLSIYIYTSAILPYINYCMDPPSDYPLAMPRRRCRCSKGASLRAAAALSPHRGFCDLVTVFPWVLFIKHGRLNYLNGISWDIFMACLKKSEHTNMWSNHQKRWFNQWIMDVCLKVDCLNINWMGFNRILDGICMVNVTLIILIQIWYLGVSENCEGTRYWMGYNWGYNTILMGQ
jgi:hypothetical protein